MVVVVSRLCYANICMYSFITLVLVYRDYISLNETNHMSRFNLIDWFVTTSLEGKKIFQFLLLTWLTIRLFLHLVCSNLSIVYLTERKYRVFRLQPLLSGLCKLAEIKTSMTANQLIIFERHLD